MKPPSRAYHLAEAANWPAIRARGLLSATALLDQADLAPAARAALERAQRPAHVALPTGAELRDQKPMPAAALANCLVGLTPAEWYALINARVFFWLDPDRLNRQRKACEPRPQVVLTLDAERLLAAHAERAAVSPINSGNARRKPASRGAATFVPYAEWLKSGWASEAAALGTRERARSHAPVELTVLGAVPDVLDFVLATTELKAGQSFTPARAG